MTSTVDVVVLEQLADDLGDDVVHAILSAFLSAAEVRRDALTAAMSPAGIALRDAAHALTSASVIVGAERLGELCWNCETSAGAGDDGSARADAQLAVMELDSVVDELARTRWVTDS